MNKPVEQPISEDRLAPDQQAFLDARNELLNSLHEWQNAGADTARVRDAIDILIMTRIEHREATVSVNSKFEGTFCPFTKRKYFMHLDHEDLGYVATYGGPFDSYTIPEPDEDGHLRCERYDHDRGEWIEGGEPTGLLVISERELAELSK